MACNGSVRASCAAVGGGAFPALPMRFVGQRVHAAGVDPSIVEIEKRTDGYGEIDGFVVPARGAQETGVLSLSSSAELSKSRSTPHTSSSFPKSSTATAAWDFSQKGQSFL